MIKYDRDPRTYYKYKKNGSSHYYVDCTAKQIDSDGKERFCSYVEKREDRHKEKLRNGIQHKCSFIIKKPESTLLDYFHEEKNSENLQLFSRISLFL